MSILRIQLIKFRHETSHEMRPH